MFIHKFQNLGSVFGPRNGAAFWNPFECKINANTRVTVSYCLNSHSRKKGRRYTAKLVFNWHSRQGSFVIRSVSHCGGHFSFSTFLIDFVATFFLGLQPTPFSPHTHLNSRTHKHKHTSTHQPILHLSTIHTTHPHSSHHAHTHTHTHTYKQPKPQHTTPTLHKETSWPTSSGKTGKKLNFFQKERRCQTCTGCPKNLNT